MGVRVILRDVHWGADPDLDCRFLLIGCVGGGGGARAHAVRLETWTTGHVWPGNRATRMRVRVILRDVHLGGGDLISTVDSC